MFKHYYLVLLTPSPLRMLLSSKNENALCLSNKRWIAVQNDWRYRIKDKDKNKFRPLPGVLECINAVMSFLAVSFIYLGFKVSYPYANKNIKKKVPSH